MGEDAGTSPVVRVVVAGGHDQVARRLERLLASAGHTTVGIVRNPDHVGHTGRRGPGLLDDVGAIDLDAVAAHLGTTAGRAMASELIGARPNEMYPPG
jgi:hypothetical protein